MRGAPFQVDRSDEADLRMAFRRFDADGDGRLSPSDLMHGLSGMGQAVSLEEVQRIVHAVTRGSGQPFIRYADFKALMRPPDAGGGEDGGGGGASGAAVVVVAHVAIDEEAACGDDLEARLKSGGYGA